MKKIIQVIRILILNLFLKLFSLLSILRIQNLLLNRIHKKKFEINKHRNFKNFISQISLKRKLISLDVGASGGFNCDGAFSKKYENFFSPILVEPNPYEAEKLKNQYIVIEKGLWSKNCTKKLYVTGKNYGGTSMYKPCKDGFSLYNPDEDYFKLYNITDEIDLECTTIKDSLANLKIKELDFLKIDTQGAEYEILKGIGSYFPLVIKIEVQLYPLYKDVPHWTEMLNYIHKLGYMLCAWEESHSRVTQSPVQMDMIFIPNYLTEKGKNLIKVRENEFIFLMLIFGQIRLLKQISKKFQFKLDNNIDKLKDKFFY
jgi:FkbM family methyltransferase